MAIIGDFNQFDGRHWETGSVHNYLAYQGYRAPHTGRPYSEALLLGVSGGITIGYFTFTYKGVDPQCNILTRNTFDPLETMLSRLGVVQQLERTTVAARASQKLARTLETGEPAIVWADRWSLPYNALASDGMWGALPVLVFGLDGGADRAYVADRAAVPLQLSATALQQARGRIKKERFRMLTTSAPDPEKLATAVQLGIWDTLKLFTEKPPRGASHNFGLAALQHWTANLTQPRRRTSWVRVFPPGLPLYAALTSAYEMACLYGQGTAADADRGRYADFLQEAAVLLDRPALQEAATLFRASATLWQALPVALLPDEVAPLATARRLMQQRHTAFLEQGHQALPQMQALNAQLAETRLAVQQDGLPLTADGVGSLQAGLAAHITRLHDAEAAAVAALAAAMT